MTRSGSFDRGVKLTAQSGLARLSLGENPMTGYLWRLADLPPDVELLGSEFRAAPTARLGTPGERCFSLRVHTPGTFRFAAELARGNEPPSDHIEVIVVEGGVEVG